MLSNIDLPRNTFEAAHKKFTAAISSQVPSRHPHFRAVPAGAIHCVMKARAAVLNREVPPSIWTDLDRSAGCEHQDKQITHDSAPFVNDKGSIYFLSERRVTNASEQFGGLRK